MSKTIDEQLKDDFKYLKKGLKEWDENEGDMQTSYPRGLAQYLEESGYAYKSLCSIISENHNYPLSQEIHDLKAIISSLEENSEWKYTEKKQLPVCYQTGEWDGTMSDFVIAQDSADKYHIAHAYSGTMDGFEYLDWYDQNDNDFGAETIVKWKEID